jgi:hypothetical protein
LYGYLLDARSDRSGISYANIGAFSIRILDLKLLFYFQCF